jgi:hypothetical protein
MVSRQGEPLATNFHGEEPAAGKPEKPETRSYWQTAQAIHKQINGEAHG